jgi:hypothetical protein
MILWMSTLYQWVVMLAIEDKGIGRTRNLLSLSSGVWFGVGSGIGSAGISGTNGRSHNRQKLQSSSLDRAIERRDRHDTIDVECIVMEANNGRVEEVANEFC